jgi:hypothetical protein
MQMTIVGDKMGMSQGLLEACEERKFLRGFFYWREMGNYS